MAWRRKLSNRRSWLTARPPLAECNLAQLFDSDLPVDMGGGGGAVAQQAVLEKAVMRAITRKSFPQHRVLARLESRHGTRYRRQLHQWKPTISLRHVMRSGEIKFAGEPVITRKRAQFLPGHVVDFNAICCPLLLAQISDLAGIEHAR